MTRGSTGLLLVLVSACTPMNRAPGIPIDCSWLEGNNCWKSTVAVASGCTDGTATGSFDALTTTCTYGDGTVVRFTNPAIQSYGGAGVPWLFTIEAAGGGNCASVDDRGGALAVTTSLGTFRQDAHGTGYTLTCPDGTAFAITYGEIFSCDPTQLPGLSWGTSGGLVSFGMLGGPVGSPDVWRCGP